MLNCKQQVPLSHSLSPFPPCARHTHAGGCSVYGFFSGGVEVYYLCFDTHCKPTGPFAIASSKKEKHFCILLLVARLTREDVNFSAIMVWRERKEES